MARALSQVVGLSALAAVTCLSGWARADHTPETPIVDQTAYTRPRNQIRVGLLKVQYGVLDSLTVGTYWLPWAVLAPNAQVKWRAYHGDALTLAAEVGALRLDTSNLTFLGEQPGEARISVFTFEPLASYRLSDAFTLSSSFVFTAVRLDGSLSTEAYDGAGQGAVSNGQVTATFEWRATRVTALVVHGRYLVAQRAAAVVDAEVRPDDYTTVQAHGQGRTSALDFPHAWSVVPSVALSWGTFYLRAGVGYGNWSLPIVNFVLPHKRVVPELDVSFFF